MKDLSATNGTLKPAFFTSFFLVALLVVAALPGVFLDGLYKDSGRLVAVDRGSDLVALIIVAPALLASVLMAIRGSSRALMVWLGLVGWVLYNYVIYAFSLHFTPLFLVHVALVSLAAFTFAIVLRRLEIEPMASEFGPHTPARILAGFLFLMGTVFVLIWMSDVLPATFNGSLPARLKELGTVSNPVEVNDLAIVMPLLFLAGAWCWQHKAVGYILGGALTTLAAVTMAALVPGSLFFGGVALDPINPIVALLSLAVLGVFFWRMGTHEQHQAASRSTGAPGLAAA